MTRILAILCLGVFAIRCAGYSYAESRTAGQGALSPGCKYQLDFAGWTYYEEDRIAMRKFLASSGLILDPAADRVLEIILEQTDITPAWRKAPNALLTIFSVGIFPLVEYFEYHLTFRVREGGQITYLDQYRIMNHTVVSVLVAPLMPFYWPSTERMESIEKVRSMFRNRFARFCAEPALQGDYEPGKSNAHQYITSHM